jgi:tetratricopeptide (TPR) repeat protein
MRRHPASPGARRFRSVALGRSAMELGEARRWQECFQRLAEAQRLAPLDAQLAANRHLLLLSAALASAEAGDAPGALSWLDQLPLELDGSIAERRRRAEAEVHWRLARASRRQGDAAEERHHLEAAIRLAPGREEIQDALIQRLYSDRNWEEAQGAIDRALQRDPGRDDLRRLSLKMSRDREALRDHVRSTSPHFTLFYPPGAAGEARRFATILEVAHERLRGELGVEPDGRVEVLIYSLNGFRDVMLAPHWAQAGYDGRLRFFLMDASTPSALARLEDSLSHELAHAFIERLTGRDFPLWLSEGLASALETHRRVTAADRDLAVEIMRRMALGSIRDVFGGIDGNDAIPEAQDAYHVAMSFAHWLLSEQPRQALCAALRAVGEGETLDGALEEHLGKPLDELDREWRASL